MAVAIAADDDGAGDLRRPGCRKNGGAVLEQIELEHALGLRETVLPEVGGLTGEMCHHDVATVAERLDMLVLRHRVALRGERARDPLRLPLRLERLRRADPFQDAFAIDTADQERTGV